MEWYFLEIVYNQTFASSHEENTHNVQVYM